MFAARIRIVLIFLLSVPTFGRANSVSLIPIADTEIIQGGTSDPTRLRVGGNNKTPVQRHRSLVRFDIAGNVPANATVTNTILTVTVINNIPPSPVNSTYDLRLVLVSWSETTADWTNRMTGIPWTSLGGAVGTDFTNKVSQTTLRQSFCIQFQYDRQRSVLAAKFQSKLWLGAYQRRRSHQRHGSRFGVPRRRRAHSADARDSIFRTAFKTDAYRIAANQQQFPVQLSRRNQPHLRRAIHWHFITNQLGDIDQFHCVHHSNQSHRERCFNQEQPLLPRPSAITLAISRQFF
jgi:hypothetical protein